MGAAFRIGDEVAAADAGASAQDSNNITLQAGDTVYVLVFSSDGSPAVPTGVAWDPTGVNEAFTKIHDPGSALFSFGYFSVWRAQGLTAKTGVIRATWSGNQGERGMIAWVGTDIDTGTPNGTIGTGTGASGATSATANTSVGQLVLGFVWLLDTGGPGTSTFDSPNGTERNDVQTSPAYDSAASQDIAASGATQAVTWTPSQNGDGWYSVAIPLNDAAPGGGGGGDGMTIPRKFRQSYRPRPFAPGSAR